MLRAIAAARKPQPVAVDGPIVAHFITQD